MEADCVGRLAPVILPGGSKARSNNSRFSREAFLRPIGFSAHDMGMRRLFWQRCANDPLTQLPSKPDSELYHTK